MTRSIIFAMCAALSCAASAQVQNTTTNYEYNTAGQLTKVTDALNRITTQDYDVLGRHVATTDARSGLTSYGYDGLDRLVKVTDARNLSTSYTIDGHGNLSKTVSPDTGISSRTFDDAGNVVTYTDAKNQTTTYRYDALNRVTSAVYADGTSATYVYDQGPNAIGRLSQVTDVSGSIQLGYDQHGRVVSETRTIGGQAYTTSYQFDQYGRASGITYPSGRAVAYEFDEAGRISQILTTMGGVPQPLASQITYLSFGGLQSLVFGNGQAYARTYDLDGRITSYTLNGQVQTVSYDAASRITVVSDGGNSANNRSYGYDQLDRLTSEQRPQRSLGYTYDAVGNRTQYVNGAAFTNYTYGTASNRLAQVNGSQSTMIASDANGSITNNGSAVFNYDARGRMISANTVIGLVTYKINALGQRVQKTTPTSTAVYHYDWGGKLIAESTGDQLTEYVYFGDIPIAVLKSTGNSAEAYYIHTDQLNTPRAISNGSAMLVWQWDSDPFGKDIPNEQPAGQSAFVFNQRFPGQQFDRESNLHYNYQRDYDPQIGRYVQSDPLGLGGGINTFSYALGNPVQYTDPTGEFVPLVIGGVCAAGGCEALFGAAVTAAAWWGISHQPRTTVSEPSIPDPITNSGSGAQSRSRSPGATKDCPPGNSDPCEEIRRQIRDIEGKLASKRRQLGLDPYNLYTRAYSVNPGGDLAGKGTYVGHMEQISGLEVGLARKKAEAAAMGCL